MEKLPTKDTKGTKMNEGCYEFFVLFVSFVDIA